MSTSPNPGRARPPTGAGVEELVTVEVAGELLGLPIERARDVFAPSNRTSLPLAPDDVMGILNLRGRVVTALSLRRVLGIGDAGSAQVALGIEQGGEALGPLVDSIGAVMRLDPEQRQPNPAHMDGRWAARPAVSTASTDGCSSS